MTDQITVPRATWDAMREALKLCYEHCRVYHPEVDTNNVGQSVRQALTAANAVSEPKGLFVDLIASHGPEFVAEMAAIETVGINGLTEAETSASMSVMGLSKPTVQPQAQGEAIHQVYMGDGWKDKPASEMWMYTPEQGWESKYVRTVYTHPQATEQAGYKLVPVELTPEMIRAIQLKSAIGAEIAANWTGAYECFQELYSVAIAAAPEAKQ